MNKLNNMPQRLLYRIVQSKTLFKVGVSVFAGFAIKNVIQYGISKYINHLKYLVQNNSEYKAFVLNTVMQNSPNNLLGICITKNGFLLQITTDLQAQVFSLNKLKQSIWNPFTLAQIKCYELIQSIIPDTHFMIQLQSNGFDNNKQGITLYRADGTRTFVYLDILLANFDLEWSKLTTLFGSHLNGASLEEIDKLEIINVTSDMLTLLDECCICNDIFTLQHTMRKLPCNHNFHKECIDSWLKLNITCPLCRVPIVVDSDQNNTLDVVIEILN
jgi:hypothetical protein